VFFNLSREGSDLLVTTAHEQVGKDSRLSIAETYRIPLDVEEGEQEIRSSWRVT